MVKDNVKGTTKYPLSLSFFHHIYTPLVNSMGLLIPIHCVRGPLIDVVLNIWALHINQQGEFYGWIQVCIQLNSILTLKCKLVTTY